MADSPKRTRSPSQSSHYSQAEIVLAQNGVFADDVFAEDGSADMDPSDQRLLTTLLEETRATVAYSSVPLNKVRAMIGQGTVSQRSPHSTRHSALHSAFSQHSRAMWRATHGDS